MQALRSTWNLSGDLSYPSDAGGKTDSQIALDVLLASGIAEERATVLLPVFQQAYHAELSKRRAELIADLRVLPGVLELLTRLQDLGVRQSVLTGNFEPVARLKLACVGLGAYIDFDLGAYGSDNPDRSLLVPVARERLRRRFGPQVLADDIVVIGDTPRDIACARAGGAWVIAVATGNFTRRELEAHHPPVVLDDLSNTQAVLARLLKPAPALH